MSEKETCSYYVEKRYDEWLESLPRNKSEVVNSLLESAYTGEGDLTLERAEADRLRAEANGLRSQAEEKERLAQEYEQRGEKRAEARPDYKEQLHALIDSLIENGTHLWEDHNRVQELATDQQKAPKDVIKDAKEIARSMDATVYNTQFVTAAEAQQMTKEPLTEDNE
ncbi:hypothetical protein HATV-3_gp66 [Haloarcula tailed virus 3]|uniref:Uncharacterized protein n=1 Tax=Haloarcula tailed virus 3 TaxID=2877990 RepID=A0AAE8XZK8_9CAUD|nr:hypothetical protein M1M35_gp66 [Haloarcula tailed virus 3]UBF23416.1 hypothetical protein HATV-3_gp66 [Haloarcula tailed virus 3]